MSDDIKRYETHLDIPLDDDDTAAAPSREPVFVDVVSRDDQVRPVIPAGLRRGNLAATLRWWAGRTARRAAFHTVRSPWYLLLAAFWAFVGVFRILGRQLAWWWVAEQSGLRWEAAKKLDSMIWMKLHKDVRQIRKTRGLWLLAELAGVLVAVLVLINVAPRWVAAAVVVIALPVLAHIGRPATHPIVTPAVVTPRFRRLTADIVLRAYYAAGFGHPDKPGQQIMFGSTMARDGDGSRVIVDLPYGKGWKDIIKPETKAALASGIDVHLNQVFFTRDKTSERRHVLFVADRDPLAVPVGRTPMLDGKPRSIWQPVKFGRDERDRLVELQMMWTSVLIGAQPRKGKTFAARLLALHAGLDPHVRLILADGKNSPDWDKFRLVAHRIIFGTHPSPRDPDPIGNLLDALREVLQHIDKVNQVLAGLPVDVCPEGKLTEQLARDPRFPDLRVWVLVMEEFQVYFETEDQDVNKEIAAMLSRILATGPSAGVILLSSSQKPSGVGAGDVSRLFNRYRDNHGARFALRCGNRVVSEAILGGDAYSEGFDASTLPVGDEYRGVGYLYGASDATPTVRTFLADHGDAERILLAARRHREHAGTLSGVAAGEDVSRESRDVLADVIRVWAHVGRPGVQWQRLAEVLAAEIPEAYAGITAESLSALLRAAGVPSVDIKADGIVLKGCRRAAVDEAIGERQLAA